MSDFEKLINASDLIEWIIETDPDWCVGSVRSIIDHIDKMPSAQTETHEERTETHACDYISRQAAYETLTEYYHHTTEIQHKALREALERVPSAQPEIIHCKDCKWKQGSECVRFAEVRPFPDDYCSRAERRTDERTD